MSLGETTGSLASDNTPQCIGTPLAVRLGLLVELA